METVRVIHHHESDGWWAEAPDVAGWSAAGETYREVNRLAEDGIRFALDRQDLVVEHEVPDDEQASA